jgi:hypothetical protein
MADISITAANVAYISGGKTTGTAGVTITAGQLVYLDAATGTVKLCDSDASAATADCIGIALHGSLAAQPIVYQTDGTLTCGGTLVLGNVYCASVNAGGLAPVADVASPARTTIVGVATSVTVLTLRLYTSGIVHA